MTTLSLVRSQREENVMRSLHAFIHYENLILFKKQLADPRIDDIRRQQLLKLLAEEQARDFLHEERATSDRAPQANISAKAKKIVASSYGCGKPLAAV
jgi:hypothetical protein